MEAARGEVVVYTDSDCEADEDWLYYLALSLVRSGHAGMGGPNLIPDEGSWVADCVGLSPGGPTHVMIDDRTAEHVPGCNMAFYTAILKQVNGFDPQYRKAGDDVDVIWRIQNLGRTMGFSPAAQVWHYRRNTIKAYLNQQRGYGEAEALLKYKHPDHFNTLAQSLAGKIYGGDEIGVRFGGDVIYHGVFGTGLFQTIYRRPASLVAMMLMSIEWHLLAVFILVVSLAYAPTDIWAILNHASLAALMFLTPVLLAIAAAFQAADAAPPPSDEPTAHRLSALPPADRAAGRGIAFACGPRLSSTKRLVISGRANCPLIPRISGRCFTGTTIQTVCRCWNRLSRKPVGRLAHARG